MSTDEPLTREQILGELDVLATVEHALIVEYLSVQCALGHDLPAEQGGATTDSLRNLATDVGSLAVSQERAACGSLICSRKNRASSRWPWPKRTSP